ncbi:MAG: efflux RND transporter periplasmic adaptor subunit [Candidatus Pristimantibacillus sp.]
MKKWTLWIGIIIIIAAVGAGAYYYFFMRDSEVESGSPTSRTATATKGDLKVTISGTGSVVANSRETVTAGKGGTIATLHFKEGDKVKKGQVLATFEDTDDYEDKINTINKSIAKVQTEIESKQEDYKSAIGGTDEETKTNSIKDEIEELQSSIADYEDELEKIYKEQAKEVKQVVATIDGEIIESTVSVGDEVDAKTTIAEIVDYTLLEFVTNIDELDIPSLKLKQNAQITLSSITDRTIDATVSEIGREGTTANGSASYEVSMLLNDIEGVLVGMSGQADIVIESRTDVVLVPVDAVIEMGGKSFVRVPSTDGDTSGSVTGQGGNRVPGQGGGTAPAQGSGTVPAQGDRQAPVQDSGTAPIQGDRTAQAQGDRQAPTQQSGGTQGDRAAFAGRTGGMENALGGRLQEVTVGISDETNVEIVSGLAEGDSVLIPIAQGKTGMGTESTTQQSQFPGGGGMGGGFPGGGMGGGGFSGGSMGGGGMR